MKAYTIQLVYRFGSTSLEVEVYKLSAKDPEKALSKAIHLLQEDAHGAWKKGDEIEIVNVVISRNKM